MGYQPHPGQAEIHRSTAPRRIVACGVRWGKTLCAAMEWYEKAESLRPEGNDETLLRWNNCARIINDHEHVEPGEEDTFVPLLE